MSNANPETTPFAAIYSRLIDGLRDCPELTALVRVGNWVRYDRANGRPDSPSNLSADLPDLAVFPTGISGASRTSSSFMPILSYAIRVRTDSLRFNDADAGLAAVLWWTYVAFERSRDRLMPGLDYVRDLTFSAAPIGIEEQSEEAGSTDAGWRSVLSVEVKCSFVKAQWGVGDAA